ncbi:MAG TPA: M20/M25/M40 family metallo-hydrolase, partial [Candidatus Eisenbacteria bacterium]|nr:M20/M25/M40 family metallo-hydrolase [Candidatus Eisenbacteria bacterium]
MDHASLAANLEKEWESSILPVLERYIAIPCLSPDFDPEWSTHGFIDQGMDLIADWVRSRGLGEPEILRMPGRTPLLLLDVPASGSKTKARTTLLYGHMDKQPEMTGWRNGLGPWKPVREGDRLYGRGGGDDGYSAFAALSALGALRQHDMPHGRAIVLIEASEESGSMDLPVYMDLLAKRIGDLGLVVCLDSGAGTYDRLWTTSSLRGIVGGTLTVEVLREGVHSGAASGIIPSSFRIARLLLSRIEDAETGRVLLPEAHASIPEERIREARMTGEILGEAVVHDFPIVPGLRPMSDDRTQLVLNQTWRPALSIVGGEGFPPVQTAGNVLRPLTRLKLSLRIPPGVNSRLVSERMKHNLETDPPNGARVRFEPDEPADGWTAPPTAPWLKESLNMASRGFFGKPAAELGEGGTIPFMGMLGERFPQAQFMITGVLGPESNAH